MARLIIWECSVCQVHHRVSSPPKPNEHCADCNSDVPPLVVYDELNKLTTNVCSQFQGIPGGICRKCGLIAYEHSKSEIDQEFCLEVDCGNFAYGNSVYCYAHRRLLIGQKP